MYNLIKMLYLCIISNIILIYFKKYCIKYKKQNEKHKNNKKLFFKYFFYYKLCFFNYSIKSIKLPTLN